MNNASTATILRLPQVIQRTGLSRSTVYKLINAGDFPKQVRLSIRCMGFRSDEVEEWIKSRNY
jgi:prophage regulatory protein